MEWQEILEPVVRKAGAIVSSFYGQKLTRHQKSQYGFVTEADIASETYIIDQLSKIFPEASFIAEESGTSGDKPYKWVIDPLDGTTNFSFGIPYFCVSVALTHNDIPIAAAIYQPLLNEFFYAERGKGAFLNGEKIHVSSPQSYKQSLIALGLPYLSSKRKELAKSAREIIRDAYAIRHLGAIALDLAYVAAGRIDGVFFAHLAWWDVAAGILLIQEAGGNVSDVNGNNITPSYTTCIAGGALVYDQLRSHFK